MEKYDLTPKLMLHLDRQLCYPLLEFLSVKNVYNKQDLLKAKFELLQPTEMVDYVGSLYVDLHGGCELPEEYPLRRAETMKKLEEFEKKTEKIRSIIEIPEVASSLRQDREQNMKFLKENYDCKPEMVRDLYDFGIFLYSCGNYGGAADMLFHFLVLSTDFNLVIKAMWGKLACEILMGNWETAYNDIGRLRENIEKTSYSNQTQQLTRRVWLLHWSLFVFFNHPNGRDGILDMMLTSQYSNTIQNACPWLVRYLVAAAIVNRRRRNSIKDVVKIAKNIDYMYRDPLTEFVCKGVLSNDFFLTGLGDDFVDCARLYFAEVYCRVYSKIDFSHLVSMLGMDQEHGEKWIVKLIRDTRLDAKVDLKDNLVVINPNSSPVPQLVIERSKFLSFRSQVLNGAIDKREAAANNPTKSEPNSSSKKGNTESSSNTNNSFKSRKTASSRA
ncbi:hypothetical protein BB560_005130 [Smittium megazygosporum]|uniref:Eukaryotic translation initiation factor 3 subunit E n=1 Tax=Smittium megazygosporum TaxID=133381 RepID=A0A2T9Z7B1_9FUNG|nr:hypothetical protein BB560_005130 [Smittium megazygosporum]